jgi:hypothetical protein
MTDPIRVGAVGTPRPAPVAASSAFQDQGESRDPTPLYYFNSHGISHVQGQIAP